MDLESFLSVTESALKLERDAEEAKHRWMVEGRSLAELRAAGVALSKLHVVDRRGTLGGRRILKLARRATDPPPLPSHKFSSGDLADVSYTVGEGRQTLFTATVSKVVETAIYVSCERSVAIDEMHLDNRTFLLVLAVNDVTYRRLTACLNELACFEKWPAADQVRLLFGEWNSATAFAQQTEEHPLNWLDEQLNEWQRAAVRYCCSGGPLAFVHGPPGTGKTRTLVEIVRQHVACGQRVLLCAPSNVAVDNVAERLLPFVRLVRLGHPARSHPALHAHTLDAALASSDQGALVADIRDEMKSAGRGRGGRPAVRQLQRELRDRERRAVAEVLRGAQVVCATLTSSDALDGPLAAVRHRPFDVVVVDECAQALEIACWMAMLQGRRTVLAGDHCQLPPTVISADAAASCLSRTLMARVAEDMPAASRLFRLLGVQYRMHADIMTWSSERFYKGALVADASVKEHTLRDLCGELLSDEVGDSVVYFIDTAGCDMVEYETDCDESKGNPGTIRGDVSPETQAVLAEVELAFIRVRQLVDAGLDQSRIALISPYNLQVQLLRKHVGGVYPQVSIRSVDGFQGQEREAVVMSLVRSNSTGVVGFLSDWRRMNVAVTRARRHLSIIGDSATVAKDDHLRSLLDFITTRGAVLCAAQFDEERAALGFEFRDLLAADGNARAGADESKPAAVGKNKRRRRGAQPAPEPAVGAEPADDWLAAIDSRLTTLAKSTDAAEQLELPASLRPSERRLVHEVAERLSLLHASVGDGAERRIVVRKKPLPSDSPPASPPPPPPPPPLPHESGGSSPVEVNAESPAEAAPKQPKGRVAVAPKNEPTPLDASERLLRETAAQRLRCSFEKCRESIRLINVVCAFCKRTFCLKHGQAEAHGCSTAAKRAAKAASKRADDAPSLSADRRKALQSTMDDRLRQMADKRGKSKPNRQNTQL